jgi:OmpA-OmpF porin, OOP family
MPRAPRVVVAVALCSVLLAGCDQFLPTSVAPTTNACGWMTATQANPATGHTVILIDRSNSTRSSAGKLGPDYTAALSDVVASVLADHDVISIGTFDGTASTVDWLAHNQVTDRGRSNPTNQAQDDRTARTCITNELKTAAAAPATSPGTDVLGAIGAGSDELAQVTGTRRLVLATDGLATVGCADLSSAGIGIVSTINDVATLCRQRGELPTIPAQVNVTFVGIGYPAATQSQPTTTQLGWLRQLWLTLCGQLHSKGAAAGSCVVSPTAPPSTTGSGRPATGSVDDPPITFLAADDGVRTPGGATVYQVPDVLFDTGQAALNSTGTSAVQTIGAKIRQQSGATVAVNGYTDDRGSVPYNLDLSQARAETVRTALAANGIVVASAHGFGKEFPACTPEYQPNGTPDQQAMQCDRRVEVVVTPPRQ